MRELIATHVQNAYLWSYARLRNQDHAVERTRAAILRAAHSLGRIPEGCSFGAWLFLELRELHATPSRSILHSATGGAVPRIEPLTSGCPEPWRCLLPAEGRAIETEVRAHTAGCATCRVLDNEFRAFLDPASDAVMLERSSWTKVEGELGCFLDGYFSNPASAPTGRPSLSQQLPLIRLSGSRLLAVGVGLAALIFLVWFVRENLGRPPGQGRTIERVERGTSEPAAGTKSPRTIVPPPQGPRLTYFEAARPQIGSDAITFTWTDPGAEAYRLSIFSPRLDTLFTAPPSELRERRIPISQLRSRPVETSLLFEVKALQAGKEIATTGFVPFTIP